MMKMMCKVVTWVLCGVLLLWVPGPRLTEAEPPSSSASSAADTVELRFRRVYVPQGAIADFTRSYMVMKQRSLIVSSIAWATVTDCLLPTRAGFDRRNIKPRFLMASWYRVRRR